MDLRSNYEEGAFELEFPGLNGSEFSFVRYGHFVIYYFNKILIFLNIKVIIIIINECVKIWPNLQNCTILVLKKKKKNIQTQVPKILNNLVRTVSPKILLANLAVKSSLLQEDYSKRS